MNGKTRTLLRRSEVAALLGVHISTIRRMEGKRLSPVRNHDGVHYFDRREVEELAAERGRETKPSGQLAARVYKLLREGKTIGEIVFDTELSPVEVRALFEQFSTPLGRSTREDLEIAEQRAVEQQDELTRELDREQARRKGRA
jgi:DNA-binding transcriptional MerR regulator